MGRKSQTSRPLPPRNVSRPLPPRSSSLPAPPEQLIIQPRAEKHVSPIPADQVVAGSPSPDLIATFASRDLVTPAGPPAEERVITVTTTYQIRTSFGLNRVIRILGPDHVYPCRPDDDITPIRTDHRRDLAEASSCAGLGDGGGGRQCPRSTRARP